MISDQFRLLYNMINKYKIQIKNLYNFDKTGFIINIIIIFIVIIQIDMEKPNLYSLIIKNRLLLLNVLMY